MIFADRHRDGTGSRRAEETEETVDSDCGDCDVNLNSDSRHSLADAETRRLGIRTVSDSDSDSLPVKRRFEIMIMIMPVMTEPGSNPA